MKTHRLPPLGMRTWIFTFYLITFRSRGITRQQRIPAETELKIAAPKKAVPGGARWTPPHQSVMLVPAPRGLTPCCTYPEQYSACQLHPLPELLPYLWRSSAVALKKRGLSLFQRSHAHGCQAEQGGVGSSCPGTRTAGTKLGHVPPTQRREDKNGIPARFFLDAEYPRIVGH